MSRGGSLTISASPGPCPSPGFSQVCSGERQGEMFSSEGQRPPPPAPCPQVFFCCCYCHFRRRPHREHLGCILEVFGPWEAMTQFLDAAA